MGSDSDLPVMQAAADILTELTIPYELTIVSAHRTPQRLFEYATTAADRGFKILIAGAGGAAHLPGMLAALTPLPVIGVPISYGALHGQDALLAITQMPPGVPVATMAIDGARNAGLLAAQILGVHDMQIRSRIIDYKTMLQTMVLTKVKQIEQGDITAATVLARH
jgi:5-(carboxyamino)imidazole ribonucleotide mutase